jgi:hypothetical protein
VGYRLRYRSAAFAEYALGHVSRLLGTKLVVNIDEPRCSDIRVSDGERPAGKIQRWLIDHPF